MNFIPCVTWIKRGVSKETPDEIKLNKDDLKRILEGTAEDLAEAENNGEAEMSVNSGDELNVDSKEEVGVQNEKDEILSDGDDDFNAKYDLDNYDDDTNDAAIAESAVGLKSIACFASNEDDPYVTIARDESDDEEEENKQIKSGDNIIAVGHVDQDTSVLEFHVYNEEHGELYVHHDVILSAYPLCLEWLDFDHGSSETRGNFMAVGSMLPQIDIWDVDIVNSLEPSYVLGKNKKKKKKSSQQESNSKDGHTDAVLSLSWNKIVRHGLASGSADHRIMLWDLNSLEAVTIIDQHDEKVQSIQWHPFEAQTLLSGSCDSTVKLFDCRNVNDGTKSWKFDSEIEKIMWDHFDPYHFYVATESGKVCYVDVRSDKPVHEIQAHDESVSGMSLSSNCPGCLITVSTDKSCKIWDLNAKGSNLVHKHNFKLGEMYCVSSSTDSPFVIAAGGNNKDNNFVVWDIRQFSPVNDEFGNRQLLQVDNSSMSKNGTENIMDS